MGTSFLEAVYQECLEKEFADRAIPFLRHPHLKLAYEGEYISQTYTPDFICFEKGGSKHHRRPQSPNNKLPKSYRS